MRNWTKRWTRRRRRTTTTQLIPWSLAIGCRQKVDFSFIWRRKADRLVIHKNFKSEALSWKGYDLALVHMTQEYGDQATEDLQTVPVCLVGANLMIVNLFSFLILWSFFKAISSRAIVPWSRTYKNISSYTHSLKFPFIETAGHTHQNHFGPFIKNY